MALIAAQALKNATFRQITGSYSYTVESTNLRPDGFTLSHKHKMLMYTKYHYNACIGGKTGYTDTAKNTLVTYATKNGLTLVCVTMENSDGTIYEDTTTVLNYCFENYERLTSATSDNSDIADAVSDSKQWASLPFSGFDIDTFTYTTDATGSLVLATQTDASTLDGTFTLAANVLNLAPYRSVLLSLGTISYTQGNQSIGSQPVYLSIADLDTDLISVLTNTSLSTDTNTDDSYNSATDNSGSENSSNSAKATSSANRSNSAPDGSSSTNSNKYAADTTRSDNHSYSSSETSESDNYSNSANDSGSDNSSNFANDSSDSDNDSHSATDSSNSDNDSDSATNSSSSNDGMLNKYLTDFCNFVLAHLLLSIVIAIVCLSALIVFLVWLIGVLKRSHHRRKYRRLRNRRLQEQADVSPTEEENPLQ